MKRSIFAGLIALAVLLPGVAAAATAFTVSPTNVRAGPGTRFPVVAVIGGGARVNIVGCVKGYSWCKLAHRGRDVWISSSQLQFVHKGRRASSSAPPIIHFSVRRSSSSDRLTDLAAASGAAVVPEFMIRGEAHG